MRKRTLYYYWMSLLVLALPARAQQKSPEETKVHTESVMRKEYRRERVRKDKAEKKAAKAEKRINDKSRYKNRRKGRWQKTEKPRDRG